MEEQQLSLNPAPPEFQSNNSASGGGGPVKLSPFWPHAPVLVVCPGGGPVHCNVDAVQQHESLRKVVDIVKAVPAEQP
jgi:hypothetical protein